MHNVLSELGFTLLEAGDLIRATERNCICAFDALIGKVVRECASHGRLADTAALRRLLFARRLAQRWRSAEFSQWTRTGATSSNG